MRLSVVSPVYNAAPILDELVRRIHEACDSIPGGMEIVLVDDRSRDDSWRVIQELSAKFPTLRGVRLSRNFGQHYAITAGLANAVGDVVVIMDSDLQDDPSYIPTLLARMEEGYDVVCTVKTQSRHSLYRRLASQVFFKIVNSLSDVTLEQNLGTMTLLRRPVVDEFLKINDYHRHSSMVIAWLGFRRGHVMIEQRARLSGESSYTFRALVAHALNGVVSQSDKVLHWSAFGGLFMFLMAFMGVVYIIIGSAFWQFQVGWPSLAVLILFTSGLILFVLGVVGVYLGKVFEQAKGRPLFIVAETTTPAP